MSLDSSYFTSMSHPSSIPVMNADGTHMPLVGVCSIITPNLSLFNLYHIPNLTLNLASIG